MHRCVRVHNTLRISWTTMSRGSSCADAHRIFYHRHRGAGSHPRFAELDAAVSERPIASKLAQKCPFQRPQRCVRHHCDLCYCSLTVTGKPRIQVCPSCSLDATLLPSEARGFAARVEGETDRILGLRCRVSVPYCGANPRPRDVLHRYMARLSEYATFVHSIFSCPHSTLG